MFGIFASLCHLVSLPFSRLAEKYSNDRLRMFGIIPWLTFKWYLSSSHYYKSFWVHVGDLSYTYVMLYVFDQSWLISRHIFYENPLLGMILRTFLHVVYIVVPFMIIISWMYLVLVQWTHRCKQNVHWTLFN